MDVQCCSCKKVRDGSDWIEKEVDASLVSHGYCPRCADVAFAMVDKHHAERKKQQNVAMEARVKNPPEVRSEGGPRHGHQQ